MPVETGTTISDLDELWPLNNDPILEGDNHLRLLKAILKSQFPGESGNGFAAPITATEAEINHLSGVTGNIQAQINAINNDTNLIAPANTVMLFAESPPPNGWTTIPDYNDRMLRLVSSTAGGTGGSESPISFSKSHKHTTQNHTLTLSQIPSHKHVSNFARYQHLNATNYPNGWVEDLPTDGHSAEEHHDGWSDRKPYTSSEGGNASHNHGDTSSSTVSWTPRYYNVIMAKKT